MTRTPARPCMLVLLALTRLYLSSQGDGIHQIREALKILAERVLILETMIGIHGE